MPFALIAFGLLLTIAGAKNNQGQLFTLLEGDFTGTKSFLFWGASVVGIGAVGYVPKLRPLSNVFLALLIVVFILAQYKDGNNIFTSFVTQLKAGTSGTATAPAVASNDNSSSSASGGSNVGAQASSLASSASALEAGAQILASA